MSKPAMPDPAGFVKSFSLFALKNLSDHGRLYTEIQRCADDDFTAPLYTTTQAEAYKDACVRQAQQWISVDDRLPDAGLLVLVYSPPQPGDWPDSIRIDFDCIDPDSDGPIWLNHSEHYEHFCMIAKGGADCPMTGPSEKAPYTHWMRPPPPPQQ